MSKREDYESRTEALVIPLVEERGFELVDVEYVKEAGEWYLRVYIDKEGGITIDDCEDISRKLSDLLDKEDYISDAYILEVSSPGLLRPFKKDRDLERNLGVPIEIRTYKAVDGSKEFVGTLKAYDESSVAVETEEGTELVFERKDISLMRKYIVF
ncbi:MAG: ribosome maturation factor RimP [Lachnospiraceae bacterium]|nr:ribosome maturation factor RimP [Lachnospiraceae bacterium]